MGQSGLGSGIMPLLVSLMFLLIEIWECVPAADVIKEKIVKLFACWCSLLITFANSLDPDQARRLRRA